ncbi:hypothetical protein IFM47457_07825 [Aspergillus lentulus]|nr:hypothetical protein IFM47457_07825 [Aspergillus lentulus]
MIDVQLPRNQRRQFNGAWVIFYLIKATGFLIQIHQVIKGTLQKRNSLLINGLGQTGTGTVALQFGEGR